MGCMQCCFQSRVAPPLYKIPLPPVLENNNIVYLSPNCPQGHPYSWYTDLPFFYNSNGLGFYAKCYSCHDDFSKPGWHCRECKINICKDCGDSINLQSPIIECSKKHPLVWSNEICAYYKDILQRKNYQFSCKLCKKTFQDGSWNCRDCDFNVCISCVAKKYAVTPPVNQLVCPKSHTLKLVTKKIPPICEICKTKQQKKVYSCNPCGHNICLSCGLDISATMIRSPGINCRENHGMSLVEVKTCKNLTFIIDCLHCHKMSMEYMFFCGICNECYCVKCGYEIGCTIESAFRKKCQKGHPLLWKLQNIKSNGGYNCSICGSCYFSGGFSCGICDEFICLKDINSVN